MRSSSSEPDHTNIEPLGNSIAHLPRKSEAKESLPKLTLGARFGAFLALVLWLILFAGGIIIDTEPYRKQIDATAAAALKSKGKPPDDSQGEAVKGQTKSDKTLDEADVPQNQRNASGSAEEPSKKNESGDNPEDGMWFIKPWLVVLLFFLPMNLALVCAAAGVLGAFGNLANLSDDQSRRTSTDNSNPYMSALLRGFFVYLFMISGLLLLDDAPFSNPNPQQYIRLAGFLSLFSFVVSYNPYVFTSLIEWAYERIQPRGAADAAPYIAGKVEKVEKTTEREKTKETFATAEVNAGHMGLGHPNRAPSPGLHEPVSKESLDNVEDGRKSLES